MTRAALTICVVLALSSAPRGARAFSEPLLYAEPSLNGGGGGRFFTGSPLDSFSCAVCHQGGPPPSVSLRGLPDVFKAGESYDVELAWEQPSRPHSLTLEIVALDGRAAGRIELPDPEDVDEAGRCSLAEDPALRDQLASFLTESGPRQIVGVSPCGARSLHFSFTAPDEPRVALTASIVRSDESEDPTGDGVLNLRRISYRKGESRPAEFEQSCSVSLSRPPGRSSAIWAAVGLLLMLRRAARAARVRGISANRG